MTHYRRKKNTTFARSRRFEETNPVYFATKEGNIACVGSQEHVVLSSVRIDCTDAPYFYY